MSHCSMTPEHESAQLKDLHAAAGRGAQGAGAGGISGGCKRRLVRPSGHDTAARAARSVLAL